MRDKGLPSAPPTLLTKDTMHSLELEYDRVDKWCTRQHRLCIGRLECIVLFLQLCFKQGDVTNAHSMSLQQLSKIPLLLHIFTVIRGAADNGVRSRGKKELMRGLSGSYQRCYELSKDQR